MPSVFSPVHMHLIMALISVQLTCPEKAMSLSLISLIRPALSRLKFGYRPLAAAVSALAGLMLLIAPSFAQAAELKVCAVPQLYQAVNYLKDHAPVKFEPVFGTANELYARIANAPGNNTRRVCDVLLSSDERLPISLIRSQKALGSSMKAFARAPLVLWSADPTLFKGHDPHALFAQQKIKSLAIADSSLTPVGYASRQAVRTSGFNTSYLKDKTYRSEHEYQVYSMVSSGNVQAGFVTLPLITSIKHRIPGSFYIVPRSRHSDIQYYGVLLMQSSKLRAAQLLLTYIIDDPRAHRVFTTFGFAPIAPEE